LAIARRLDEMHGGTIEARSNEFGASMDIVAVSGWGQDQASGWLQRPDLMRI